MSAGNDQCRIGVILAAGRGGRMGGQKQLIPWPSSTGTRPLVAASYDAIRPICTEMVVVLGHIADLVVEALGDRSFFRVESDPDALMFESIRAGLRAALTIHSEATIVLQPGDHPEVATDTLKQILEQSRARADHAIIPQFADRGGHPVLIPARICRELVRADCPHGLGQYWLDHPELCHRVPVADQQVRRDIDTPADLH